MATTTRTRSAKASKTTAAPVLSPVPEGAEAFDLPDSPASDQLLADFAEARAQKGYWEKREKALKAEVKLKTGAPDLPENTPLFVRLRGALRLKITWGTRTGNDTELLQNTYPEAYEGTRFSTSYQIVSPV
jgi:hypothetical protein